MVQGQEFKTRAEPQVEIQERGEIFFFYRPKVEKKEAHGLDDVQRMYIVLRPESGENAVEDKQDPDSGMEGALRTGQASSSGHDVAEGGHGSQEVNIEKQPLLRLIIMGRKSLPHPSKKSRPYWGFVDMVTTNIQDVKTTLQAEEYDTSTRGHRHISAARALGEGIYHILRHNNPEKRSNQHHHTHLIYKLEFPTEDESNGPQKSFNIEREGSFLIQIKNPEYHQHGSADSQYRGLQNKRRAQFPARLQGQFGYKRFHPADPPDYLNFEGCEFLLISASDDVEEELGLEMICETETGGGGEGDADAAACSDLVKTFGETTSTQPLLKGRWV